MVSLQGRKLHKNISVMVSWNVSIRKASKGILFLMKDGKDHGKTWILTTVFCTELRTTLFKKSRCWPCDHLRLSLWTHTFWCQLMIGNCPIFCSLFNLNRTTNQELSIIDVCTDHRWCLGNKQRRQWMWPVRSSVQIIVRSLCQHGLSEFIRIENHRKMIETQSSRQRNVLS